MKTQGHMLEREIPNDERLWGEGTGWAGSSEEEEGGGSCRVGGRGEGCRVEAAVLGAYSVKAA